MRIGLIRPVCNSVTPYVLGSNLLGLHDQNGITRERALQSLQPSLHATHAADCVPEPAERPAAAKRRRGRACGDTAGCVERSSMPTAGSLDLPSFGATVLTTGLERAARRQQRCARTTGRGTTRALRAKQARLCGS